MWEVITENGTSNILPIQDSRKHLECVTCHCNPRTEVVNQMLIIIHNSFDGREAVEWANELLNQLNLNKMKKFLYEIHSEDESGMFESTFVQSDSITEAVQEFENYSKNKISQIALRGEHTREFIFKRT